MRKSILIIILLLFVFALVIPTTTAVVADSGPDSGPIITPGKWGGRFTRSMISSGVVSGTVSVSTESSQVGDYVLYIASDNTVTGKFDPVDYSFEYEIKGLGGSSGRCIGTEEFEIQSGSVAVGAGGLPVIDLAILIDMKNVDCNPNILIEEGYIHWTHMILQAENATPIYLSGNKIEFPNFNTGFDISSMQKAGADVVTDEFWDLVSYAPVLQSLTPTYIEYFLEDVGVENLYSAFVDWRNGIPGNVKFTLNDQTVDGQMFGDEATATFKLGDVPPGTNPLTAIAYNMDGDSSQPMTYDVIIVPTDPWAVEASFKPEVEGNHVIYSGKSSVPEEPLQLFAQIPEEVPFLGGKWGLIPTQIDVYLSANSLGGAYGDKVEGKGGLGVGGKTFNLNIDGESSTLLTPTLLDVDSSKTYADLKLDPVTFEKSVGLSDLIPGANLLSDLPVIGDLLSVVDAVASIKGSITAELSGKTNMGVAPAKDKLVITEGEATSKATVKVEIPVNIQLAWAKITGGGSGSITMGLFPDINLKDCLVKLFFEASAGVADIFGVDPVEYKATWPVYSCQSSAYNAYHPLAIQTSRSPIEPLGLSLRPDDWSGEQACLYTQEVNGFEETVLAEGAGLNAQPVLALSADGKEMAFVWSGEDANKPRQQASEIRMRIFDGESWGDTISITNDTNPDLNPIAVYDHKGNIMVVWNRNKDAELGDDVELNEAFAKSLEIAYALVNPSNGKIVKSGSLTDNEMLDFYPLLVTGKDGNLWAAWQSSDAANMMGTTKSPNKLLAARWDGKKWSDIETITDAVVGTLWWNMAAYDEKKAMVVLDQDTDGKLSSVTDREMLIIEREGDKWSEPRFISSNDVLDIAPHIVYRSDGSAVIAWVSGEEVVGLIGDLGKAAEVWLGADAQVGALLGNGALVTGETGQLLLMWPGSTEIGADIMMSEYDSSSTKWGTPQALFQSEEMELSITAAIAPDGSLLVGMSRVAISNQNVDIGEGEMLDISVPADVSDLVVARKSNLLKPTPESQTQSSSKAEFPTWLKMVLGLICVIIAIIVVVILVVAQLSKKKKVKPIKDEKTLDNETDAKKEAITETDKSAENINEKDKKKNPSHKIEDDKPLKPRTRKTKD